MTEFLTWNARKAVPAWTIGHWILLGIILLCIAYIMMYCLAKAVTWIEGMFLNTDYEWEWILDEIDAEERKT